MYSWYQIVNIFYLVGGFLIRKSASDKISPEYSLEGQMLKLKLQQFDHLMQKVNSLEKTLLLGKIEVRRRME